MSTPKPTPERPRKILRRRILQVGGGLAAAGLGLGFYAWRIEPVWLEVVRRLLPIENLPADWQGRRIVQISDLHVGNLVDSNYLIGALGQVAELKPDLVVITGDFMSCESGEQVDEALRVCSHLAVPRLGAFAIFGNHDYGRGWTHVDAANRLAMGLGKLGIPVLRNERREIQGLNLIGFDELWARRFNLAPLSDFLANPAPSIALCHNPDGVNRPGWGNFRGWILSGHTHGGQCKPPFLPPPILPVQNRRYTSGAFDLGQGRNLYISRGVGYLRRVRFNARPEISCLELTRA